jgi:osmotically inducible protein OsmC
MTGHAKAEEPRAAERRQVGGDDRRRTLESGGSELPFDVVLEWSGAGGEGMGRISTDDLEIEYSVPASMGGRGVGSNPEELLVCAVGACYSATLYGLLRRAGLPASAVRVAAAGTVSGYPAQARFARLTVSPTIVDGATARLAEYEEVAEAAHRRCFIGRTIAGNVDYELGTVSVAPAPDAA